ncbi:type II toxin-antitoxin system HicB family antitoxin [Desulfolutivibrio sulfoxidireducens]|uniref:type II toxin-antitoxin system HicB family antitoxin n=1 Tax=Desulfolutivibrio sulfoxidireducens TaxID=2773299 RepID=UPI00159EA350|nr:type II toxin-antitoxin system HicB family antitoxin [Desulfolutivibrio sulfoxidireducens]QLA16008.1 CopG family transcriptional regulator [Desulfolutivibrio sulfoxidireducens]QLA20084.1 CopG family transcriptional regulator [Desulfolutivibrio sulfoxidireducens]
MAIYPAFFESGEDGHVVVSFPDLPGCLTQGETESEAMAMAIDALGGHIATLRDLGRDVPQPTPLSRLTVPQGLRVALVPGPIDGEPPVRINISINKGLLREVDACAKREGMTRSGFLASAAKSKIVHLQS